MSANERHFSALRSRRGIVLVLALWVLGTLVILSLNLNYRIRLTMALTDYREDRDKGEALLRSGLARALWAIRNDRDGELDYRGESWGTSISMDQEGLVPETLLGRETPPVEWFVVDEGAKLNVNVAPEPVLANLIRILYPDVDPEEVAGHIVNWRDESGQWNADLDYYPSLQLPYQARQGPLPWIEELRAIRGISPAMYFGNSGESAGFEDIFARGEPVRFGLRDLLTTQGGDATVNVNTASTVVLKAIFESFLDPAQAAENAGKIHRQRSGGDGIIGTDDDEPLRSNQQIAELIGNDNYLRCRNMGLPLGVKSPAFSIEVRVNLDRENIRMSGRGLIIRAEDQLHLAYWRRESI